METEFKIGDKVKFVTTGQMEIISIQGDKAECQWKNQGQVKTKLVPIDLLRIEPNKYDALGVAVKAMM